MSFFLAFGIAAWHIFGTFMHSQVCDKQSLPQLAWLLFAVLAGTLPPLRAATNEATPLGFTGTEIFPIDASITCLRHADVDGDGRNDLIVANNGNGKIMVLYNQTGQTNRPPATKTELNELPPDSRFRIESVASEKRIADLLVVDLNGDRRPDLAYYGEPKELIVQYNQGSGGWSQPKRWPIEDGQQMPNCLAAGDLNGDGLADLLVLGESQMHLFLQKSDHTLSEPEKVPFSGSLRSIQMLDIDGDGRQDLLLSNWDSSNPLRIRLQNPGGRLGPEIHFETPPIRSYWADDLDGDRKTEIVTINQASGRAQIFHFARQPAEDLTDNLRLGQLQVLPLAKTAKSKRGIVWGDVNADQRADLVMAEPDTGQLGVYLQRADGSLEPGQTFPTLTGVSELALADWDQDGRAEIFVLSADERQVGVTRYETNGRVAFPTLVRLDGKPLTMTVGPLAGNQRPTLAIIAEQNDGRWLVTQNADGKSGSHKLAASFKANPASMTVHDADQDGQNDLIVLIPYEKIKILRQPAAGKFEECDVAPPGGEVEQPWLARADVDGDGKIELLLAQKNFVRAVVLQAENADNSGAKGWALTVKDQINGAGANSQIVGATALSDAKTSPALFLMDAGRKLLTITRRDAQGVWRIVRNQSLPFTEFNDLQTVALGDKSANAIALNGLNAIAWLGLGGDTWQLKESDGYETPIKSGRLMDLVAGDLNHDGRKDLVFLETARNYVDVVTFTPAGKLTPANRWPVFEERTFRSRRSDAPEPRESVIADFTNDGKNDLVLMVHDRLLLYPQE